MVILPPHCTHTRCSHGEDPPEITQIVLRQQLREETTLCVELWWNTLCSRNREQEQTRRWGLHSCSANRWAYSCNDKYPRGHSLVFLVLLSAMISSSVFFFPPDPVSPALTFQWAPQRCLFFLLNWSFLQQVTPAWSLNNTKEEFLF